MHSVGSQNFWKYINNSRAQVSKLRFFLWPWFKERIVWRIWRDTAFKMNTLHLLRRYIILKDMKRHGFQNEYSAFIEALYYSEGHEETLLSKWIRCIYWDAILFWRIWRDTAFKMNTLHLLRRYIKKNVKC